MPEAQKVKRISGIGARLSSLKMHAYDELSVYLVGSGIKPSAEIGLDLPKEKDLEAGLAALGFKVKIMPRTWYDKTVDLALDDERLKVLVNARTSAECGLALGYPEATVRKHLSDYDEFSYAVVEGLLRCGRALASNAYVINTPSGIFRKDGGIVAPDADSHNLAKRYMAHVRENNGALAKRVESFNASELQKELVRQRRISREGKVVVNGEHFELVGNSAQKL